MDWISKDARDIPPDVKLICHKNRNCGIVICILCDSAWCRGDLNRKVASEEAFYVTKNTVVCPAHSNITYKNLLNATQQITNVEVALLKNKASLINEQIGNIEKGLNCTNEIFMDLKDDSDIESRAESVQSSKSKKRKLDTVNNGCDSCNSYVSQIEVLNSLTAEVTKQNDELREDNKFLRSLVQDYKQPPTFTKTFADATSSNSKQVKKRDTVQLIVQPNQNFNGDVSKIVKKEILNQTTAKVVNYQKLKNNTMIVKCNSKADSDIIIKTLAESNKNDITVSHVQKKDPQIKIINIDCDLNKDELTIDIINRNEFPQLSFNVVHMFKQRNGLQSAIAQVTSQVYGRIMAYGSVFVGYQNCKVFDIFNMRQCKKCCGFGHKLTKCPKERKKACLKCSGNHDATECSSETMCCINCKSANKYMEKKRDTCHSADDCKHCETFKARWEREVSRTNYPWKPKAPFET